MNTDHVLVSPSSSISIQPVELFDFKQHILPMIKRPTSSVQPLQYYNCFEYFVLHMRFATY